MEWANIENKMVALVSEKYLEYENTRTTTQLTILRWLLVVFRGDHNQRVLAAGIA
jgi:hypothetical protein